MNSSVADESKRIVPLWLVISITTALILIFSYIGLIFLQEVKTNPQTIQTQQLNRSQLEKIKVTILQEKDVIDTNWLRTLNPLVKNVQGRLLWSSQKQQGVIELINLPNLKSNQQYRLWVYDLKANNSKPITVAVIKSVKAISNIFSTSFKPKNRVISPLKFELVLEENGVNGSLPLLLAQP